MPNKRTVRRPMTNNCQTSPPVVVHDTTVVNNSTNQIIHRKVRWKTGDATAVDALGSVAYVDIPADGEDTILITEDGVNIDSVNLVADGVVLNEEDTDQLSITIVYGSNQTSIQLLEAEDINNVRKYILTYTKTVSV